MNTREQTAQTRQQIIDAADTLFYQRGYNLTSFSDIAALSGVPRGNLNYYFKSKSEVLAAVIQHRIEQMQAMLREWERRYPTPLQRLQRYVQIVSNVKDEVIHYGCPMGTLNAELGKLQHDLQIIAREQFLVFERWLKSQFQALGYSSKAAGLTMHLMVRTQGISTMAYVHQDKRLIKREVDAIFDWLTTLAKQAGKL